MSGANTPRSGGQPKQMSSRLLTMKFMQRAAVSSPSQSPYTPTQGPLSAKRPCLETSTPNSTPGTPPSNHESPKEFADRNAVAAALRAQADLRLASRAKLLRGEGGDTEWVLNVNLPLPATNGGAEQDEEAEDSDENRWSSRSTGGRQTYGGFKGRKITTVSTPNGIIGTNPEVPYTSNSANLSPTTSLDSDSEEGEISSSPAGTQTSTYSKRKNSDFDSDRRLDTLNLSEMNGLSGRRGGRMGGGGGARGASHREGRGGGGRSGGGGGDRRKSSGSGSGNSKYKQTFASRKDRRKPKKTM